MATQLRLLDPDQLPSPQPARPAPATALTAVSSWAPDDRTCEIGRRGVEEARRALAAAVAHVARAGPG
ncbi:MAG: hypothetical protein ACYDEN_05500 [Acidimicrobiales bacterium]